MPGHWICLLFGHQKEGRYESTRTPKFEYIWRVCKRCQHHEMIQCTSLVGGQPYYDKQDYPQS